MKIKSALALFLLLLLFASDVFPGTDYDKCREEANNLRAAESEKCTNLSKLLNPSGCYAAQKALKVFASGECRQIAEKVEGKAKSAGATDINKAGPVAEDSKSTAGEQSEKLSELDILKAENVKLKAEILRLKTERDRLKKPDGQ